MRQSLDRLDELKTLRKQIDSIANAVYIMASALRQQGLLNEADFEQVRERMPI